MIKNIKKLLLILLVVFMMTGCSGTKASGNTKNIKLLATSDIHGKFTNYDYLLDTKEDSGSLAQITTVINKLRDKNTIVIDAGDFMQGNLAEIFINEDIHPMISAMNKIGYDIQITGNHEYNYGVDTLKKIMSKSNAKVLTGNVYDSTGKTIFEPYTIIEKDGVKVGIIGMVTPNILRWDSANLKDYKVTDPVEETKKIIQEIKDKCDVLVAVEHMGENNEYGVSNSGVTDLANACPELDVIIAAHEHKLVENSVVNGVLIVENKDVGKTIQEVNLTLEKDGNKYKVVDKKSQAYETKDQRADDAIVELTAQADAKAKIEAHTIIGTLVNGPLVPENEIKDIPQSRLQETKLVNLIDNVMMYYSGADIAATAVFMDNANMQDGDIRKCDVANIYKYTNTLYKLKINGRQLKQYMEWSASYYNTYHDGDLIITFNPDIPGYNYDMFTGVKYEVNVAKEPGSRIENLRKMDDTPIKDNDEFTIAVNNYRATSQLLQVGSVYYVGDTLPELIEMDVMGNIGGVRDLIQDYIMNVCHGILIAPELTNNWKIVGNNWDPEYHNIAVQLINTGTINLEQDENGNSRTSGFKAITKEDVDKIINGK